MKLKMPINMLATMLAIAALIACVTIRELYVRAHPPNDLLNAELPEQAP